MPKAVQKLKSSSNSLKEIPGGLGKVTLKKVLINLIFVVSVAPSASAQLKDGCLLVIASRSSLSEARAFAMSSWDELDTAIHKAPNRYFAISAGVLPRDGSARTIQRLVSEGKIPADSFCTSAKDFEFIEVPSTGFWLSSPIFAFGQRAWPNPPTELVVGFLLSVFGLIFLLMRCRSAAKKASFLVRPSAAQKEKTLQQTDQRTAHALKAAQRGEPGEKYKYWVFISYAHQDKKFARRLKKKLSTFRVNAELRAQSETPPRPETGGKVFLDQDNMVKDGKDLPDIIRKEISQSQKIIVICSPNSADPNSHVHLELEAFTKAGKWRDIHPVIASGDPRDVGGKNDCFPGIVRRRHDNKGRQKEIRNPLSPDFRTNARLSDPLEWANLLSGVLSVNRDLIYDVERRHRFRSLGIRIIAISGIAAVGIYAGASVFTTRIPKFESQHVFFAKFGLENKEFLDFLSENSGRLVEISTRLNFDVSTTENMAVNYICNRAHSHPTYMAAGHSYAESQYGVVSEEILDGHVFNRTLQIPYGHGDYNDESSRCPGRYLITIESDNDRARSSAGGTGMNDFPISGFYRIQTYFSSNNTEFVLTEENQTK